MQACAVCLCVVVLFFVVEGPLALRAVPRAATLSTTRAQALEDGTT